MSYNLRLAPMSFSLAGESINATCADFTSCSVCVGSKYVACDWCSNDATCIDQSSSSNSCSDSIFGTCSESTYTIFIITIIVAVVLLCCCSCYCYRLQSNRHNQNGELFAPLMYTRTRDYIFRNSLTEDGESEWMCIICGFDNKPRSKHCTMCGTSHQFSVEYKNNKFKSHAKRKEEKDKKARERAERRLRIQNESNAPIRGEDIDIPIADDAQISSAVSASLRQFASPKALPADKRQAALNYRRLNQLTLRQKSARRRKMWQRAISKETGQLMWVRVPVKDVKVGQARFGYTPGNSFSISFFDDRGQRSSQDSCSSSVTGMTFRSSMMRGEHPSQVVDLMQAAKALSSPVRNSDERRNSGDLGNQNSFTAGDGKLSSAAYEPPIYTPSMGSSTPISDGTNSAEINSSSGVQNPLFVDVNDANRGSNVISISGTPMGSKAAGISEDGEMWGEKTRTIIDERGLIKDKPNAVADTAIQLQEASSQVQKTPSHTPTKKHSHRDRGANLQTREKSRTLSLDSFGDPVLGSCSPGFTSVFDENGNLQWARVEPGTSIVRSVRRAGSAVYPNPSVIRRHSDEDHSAAALANTPPRRSFAGMAGLIGEWRSGTATAEALAAAEMNAQARDAADARKAEMMMASDLESVAAMTFREKQMWFVERMAELQVPWNDGFVKMEVRRSHIMIDSYRAFMQLRQQDLHKWLRIQFCGEEGIDAGGLEREWFGLVIEAMFNPANGLFTCSTGGGVDSTAGAYHINPTSSDMYPQHLNYFRVIGRIVGKAMMEQQAIQAALSLPLRKQILSMPITFSDLEFVDQELYNNLIWLKTNQNVEELELDHTISYAATFGTTITYDLIPNGSEILVTDANKEAYLQLRLRHRMLDSIKPQLEHFLIGLYEVIPPELLSVFDYQELELLICGIPTIDLEDWMRHTEYMGLYFRQGARHPVIQWFWRAVEAMTDEERIRLLQFTTGCSRLPAQGFKALQSSDGRYRRFNIQCIQKSDSIYPRAHTCFNKLDLPLYDSESELEAYLSVVVNMEPTGFSME